MPATRAETRRTWFAGQGSMKDLQLATGLFAGGLTRLLTTQFVMIGAVFVGYWGCYGLFSALPAWYGGMVAMVSVAWLNWRRQQSRRQPEMNAEKSLRLLYKTVLERFLVVVVLLALAMGPLGLDPLPVLIGFIAGQLGMILAGKQLS